MKITSSPEVVIIGEVWLSVLSSGQRLSQPGTGYGGENYKKCLTEKINSDQTVTAAEF